MPRKAVDSEVRLRSLNLKTTEDLRARLERAAADSGRALTHEVEARLARSFRDEELFVDVQTYELVMSFAQKLRDISPQFGNTPWHENNKMTWEEISPEFEEIYFNKVVFSWPKTPEEIKKARTPLPSKEERDARMRAAGLSWVKPKEN